MDQTAQQMAIRATRPLIPATNGTVWFSSGEVALLSGADTFSTDGVASTSIPKNWLASDAEASTGASVETASAAFDEVLYWMVTVARIDAATKATETVEGSTPNVSANAMEMVCFTAGWSIESKVPARVSCTITSIRVSLSVLFAGCADAGGGGVDDREVGDGDCGDDDGRGYGEGGGGGFGNGPTGGTGGGNGGGGEGEGGGGEGEGGGGEGEGEFEHR